MKYWDGYSDGAQGKPPRYPLRAGSLRTDQGSMEVLASHALSMSYVYAMSTFIEIFWDSPIIATPTEG